MPWLGDGSIAEPTYNDRSVSLDQTAHKAAQESFFGTLATAAGYIGGSVVDLADTVVSSVPGVSHITGAKRGELNASMLRAIDMPGLNDFYAQHKEGLEVASGVTGIVAAELVTRRFTEPASLFMRGMRATPYLRRLAALDEQYAGAMATVRAVDTSIASRGIMGAAQYSAEATIARSLFDVTSNTMVDSVQTLTRNAAVRNAKGLGFLKGARNAAITEGIIATTLNQNGFLFDDSAAYNIAFGALGLGIGGGIEALHSAYQIRKFANSDLVRRTFASALDPDSVESGRLTWMGKPIQRSELEPGDYFGGTITDKVTSLTANASRLKELPINGVEDARTLMASRDSLAAQHLTQAREEMQKVTTKGLTSDGRTRFSMDTSGFGNHVDMMLYRDPAAFYGAEYVAAVPDDLSIHQITENHVRRTQARLSQQEKIINELTEKAASGKVLTVKDRERLSLAQEMTRRLKFDQQLTPMVAIDGELMPLSEGKAFEEFVEPEIKAVNLGESDDEGIASTIWETVVEQRAASVSLDDQLTLKLPGNKTLDTADHYDIMRAYRVAQRAIKRLAKTDHTIVLPNKPTWFQLDMAEELIRQSNGNVSVRFPKNMTRESAQVESLAQKVEALKKVKPLEARRAEKVGDTYEGRASMLRLRYNLPRLSAYERGVMGTVDHPIDMLLRGADSYGVDELRKMSLQDVKEATAAAKRLGDIAPVSKHDISSVYGSSFKMMQDEKGNPIKPLLVYKRPFKDNDWTVDTIAERLAARKIRTVTALTDEKADPLNKMLTQAIVGSDDFHLASRTDELMDTQIQGSFLGAAPQTPLGAIPKAVVTTEWMARDTPGLLAAGRVRDTAGRIVRDAMEASIAGAFGDQLKLLSNPRNGASKLLLNQFHSFRGGWDLDSVPVKKPDGFYAFKLGDTERNREMWREIYGTEFKAGTTLKSPDGKEIVLDELGLQIQSAYNKVTGELIQMKNTLLRSMGRGKINSQNHFVPSPSTDGKLIGFVLGPDNKVVRNMTVVEDTAEGFAKSKAEVMRRLDAMGDKGMGYVFKTQDEIRQFATIWDRVDMDFINPGLTAVQPGKRGAGRLTGPQVKLDAFENSMKYLQDQFLRHGNDVVETLFKEQINSAKARANIASEMTRNRNEKDKYRSIYDFYLENLLGTSKLNNPGSPVGWFYRGAEKKLDSIFEQIAPKATLVWDATRQWLTRAKIWDSSEEGRKDFDRLSRELGDYMPFGNAVEMMERKSAGATPWTTAQLTGGVNRVSAALMLRIAEVAHPIMNLSGIINSMPAVIRSFQPMAGESAEDFAKRIGHSAQTFNVGGENISVPDIVKIARRSFKNAWSRAAHADYDFMVRRGYLSQEVAEFQKQFAVIDSPGKIKQWAEKSTDWLSTLSDKSEDFSRSWGHFIGLEVADALGVTGRESRHMFAHDIANKMIANYDPQNRPEIFQGALGAPLGLFQSFAQNYYQKLFRYVETKDLRSFATQYAVQSSLFGVTGVAGWQQMSDFVQSMTDGEDDATTGLHGRIPGTFGDILAHGLISNVPELFGQEGVDLYSRGDTSFRLPGVGDQRLPGVAVGAKIWEGINAGLQAFKQENSTVTRTQLAEIASNMVVNRPIAGMIEEFLAHGNDTDAYGQLVTDTKNWAEWTYRLLGVRSQRQSMELTAFYADKSAQEHKAAGDDVLRTSSRAAIREGREDLLPTIFEKYMNNGGDPRQFRRWFKENYEAATTSRSQRALDKLLKAKNPDMERIMRFIDMGVGIDEDEAVGDVAARYGYSDELEQPTQELGQYSGQMTIDATQPMTVE